MNSEFPVGDNWKSTQYRQQIIAKIEHAMRNSPGPFPIRGDASQVEDYIFQRSSTLDEYMHDVGRVMLMSKGQTPTTGGNPQQQQQQQMNMVSQPVPMGAAQMQQQYQPQDQSNMMSRMPQQRNMGGMAPQMTRAARPMMQGMPMSGQINQPMTGGMGQMDHRSMGGNEMDQSSVVSMNPMQQDSRVGVGGKHPMAVPQQQQQMLVRQRGQAHQKVMQQQQQMQPQYRMNPQQLQQGPSHQMHMAPTQQMQMHPAMQPMSVDMQMHQQSPQPIHQSSATLAQIVASGQTQQYRPATQSMSVMNVPAGQRMPIMQNQQQGLPYSQMQGANRDMPVQQGLMVQQHQMTAGGHSGMGQMSGIAPPGHQGYQVSMHQPGNAPGQVAPQGHQLSQMPVPMYQSQAPSPGYPQGPSPGYGGPTLLPVGNQGPPSIGQLQRGSDISPNAANLSGSGSGQYSGPPSVTASGAPGETNIPPSSDDTLYREKIKELSIYLEPLKKALEDKDEKSTQKFHRMIEILEGRSKTSMETLLKCENLLKQMFSSQSRAAPEAAPEASICQPLLDAVMQVIKQPNANAALKRTFAMSESFLQGKQIRLPSFCNISGSTAIKPNTSSPLPPQQGDVMPILSSDEDSDLLQTKIKKDENSPPGLISRTSLNGCNLLDDYLAVPNEDTLADAAQTNLPEIFMREIASLEPRFKITLDKLSSIGKTFTLLCDLSCDDLPSVPNLKFSISQNYPQIGAKCDNNQLLDYSGTPFLESIYKSLTSKLQKFNSPTVTLLLDSWEASVRQACFSSAFLSH